LCFIKIKNVLNDVITKRILDKGKGVFSNAGNELSTLVPSGVVNAALQHATAVSVCSDDDTMFANCVVNEF
jgi:hypothetical protein